MKTTLKKTMAALSAAAVVAASAAVMAVPASAAECTISVGSQTVTLKELAAANYQVNLPISSSADLTNVSFGLKLNDGLKFVESEASGKGSAVAVENNGFVFWPFAYANAQMKPLPAGQIGYIIVEVPDSAEAGQTFTITAVAEDADGTATTWANGGTGDKGTPSMVNGVITIAADPTEAPAPTETPTEAPSEAPATEAPVATGTTAATTTKKAAAKSTSSPKTGDALPVAGVAVAVAVIGGVALVSKKRK